MNRGETELLPCPFCGGTDIRRDHNLRTGFEEVFCDDCGATVSEEKYEASTEAWNRRSTPIAAAQQVKLIATKFFRWWWNQPGAYTDQCYDEWAETEGAPLLAALSTAGAAEPVATVHVFESTSCNGRKMGRIENWDRFIKSLPVGDHPLFASPPSDTEEKAREQVAAFMIRNSFATGHGETLADLLTELEAQVQERAPLALALEEIRDRHIPDCPSHFAGSEFDWVVRQHASLRDIARKVLPNKGNGQ